MRIKRFRMICAWGLLFFGSAAQAGNYYGGKITQIVIGRYQDRVSVQISGGLEVGWPCGSRNANLNYIFPMSRPDSAALISILNAAYVADLNVMIIGDGTCSIESDQEDIGYIWIIK